MPGDTDLVGVATTNYAGRFGIDQLSHRLTREVVSLTRQQEYQIQILAPQHYILKGTLEFDRGTRDWTFLLLSKDYSLTSDDDTSTPSDPEGSAVLSMGGAIRKGS